MKTSSAKAKGRRLQQLVVKKILDTFPHLSERDVQSTSMGATGEDVKLSFEAFKAIPVSIECKNQEANKSLLKMWQQAISNATASDNPLLVISANNSPVLAIMELDMLLGLYSFKYSILSGKNENKN